MLQVLLFFAITITEVQGQVVRSEITAQPLGSEKFPIPSCRLICPGYNNYQSYCLCETNRLLQGKAIIYSFGVGEDMSFEEALIKSYHVNSFHAHYSPTLINRISSLYHKYRLLCMPLIQHQGL